MKKIKSSDYIHDLIEKIKCVKNCIKENTSREYNLNQTITFETKDKTHIQIRLYN